MAGGMAHPDVPPPATTPAAVSAAARTAGSTTAEDPMAARRRERFWHELLRLIEAGQVVPIVGRELLQIQVPPGAGAPSDAAVRLQTDPASDGEAQAESSPAPAPVSMTLWLAQQLAAQLGVSMDDLPAGDPLNHIFCRYFASPPDPQIPLEPRDLYGALFDIHKSLAGVEVPRPLVQLASITPFSLYVTSTFDDLLRRALERARPRSGKSTDAIVYRGNGGDAEDLPGRIEQLLLPTVFHLFGTISPNDNDFVVTEEDALEFFNSLQSAKRPTRLFEELNRKDLLVVGCRFPAWLVRSFIRMARGERLRLARGRTVFVVDTGAREDRALLDFLSVFRTRTDVVEHTGPVEFVDELFRRWKVLHPEPEPQAPLPPRVTAAGARSPDDAVFLSYASEDRPAVESIARLLEAKLDTWFDRDQLMGGDRFEDRIRDNIERCRLFVPVLSRRWELQEERFFWREWRQALHRADAMPPGRLFIAPIVIDDLSPKSDRIPHELRDLNWLPFGPGREAELCEKLQQAYKTSQTGSR